VVDITAGGDFSMVTPHAQLIGIATTSSLSSGPNGELFWLVAGQVKKLYDATLGGDLTLATPLITFTDGPWTNAYIDGLGLVVGQNGTMANDGKVYTYQNNAIALHAHGLKQYVRGVAHVEGCGDGLVNGMETCDDANALNGDGCSAQCALEQMGTGGAGGSGVGGSGTGGAGTGGAGTGGAGTGGSGTGGAATGGNAGTGGAATGGSSTGGSGSGATSSASGASTTSSGSPTSGAGGSAPTDEGDDGCSCRTAGGDRGAAPFLALLLAFGIACRRRRATP